MKTQHTPGPWRYWLQRRPLAEDTCTFRNPDGIEVLRAVTTTLTEADTRLIAAAPELLEALQGLLVVAENGVMSFGAIRAAREAIAKVTGAQDA